MTSRSVGLNKNNVLKRFITKNKKHCMAWRVIVFIIIHMSVAWGYYTLKILFTSENIFFPQDFCFVAVRSKN